MNEFAEKLSDKFLEYCSGKVFLLSWKSEFGFNIADRWLVIGDDACIALNYIKSSNQEAYECCRFDPYSFSNNTKYLMCFSINEELHVDKISSIMPNGIEIITCNEGLNMIQSTVNHIYRAIGEDNGN